MMLKTEWNQMGKYRIRKTDRKGFILALENGKIAQN